MKELIRPIRQITARTAMAHLGLKPNTFYRRVAEYEKGKGE